MEVGTDGDDGRRCGGGDPSAAFRITPLVVAYAYARLIAEYSTCTPTRTQALQIKPTQIHPRIHSPRPHPTFSEGVVSSDIVATLRASRTADQIPPESASRARLAEKQRFGRLSCESDLDIQKEQRISVALYYYL